MLSSKPGNPDEKDGIVAADRGAEESEVVIVVAEPVMNTIKGELQAPAFRDWQFLILFWLQVSAIASTAIAGLVFAVMSSQDNDNMHNWNDDATKSDEDKLLWNSFLFLVGSFGAGSLVVMSAFRVMVHYPIEVIRMSFFVAPLAFAVVELLLWMIDGTGDDDQDAALIFCRILAIVCSALSVYYYVLYRHLLSFAAVNLKVALTAVRVNKGLFFLSLTALKVTFAWGNLWSWALVGVLYHAQHKPPVSCQEQDPNGAYQQDQMCLQKPSTFAIIMLLLCLYWTQQVIQNTVHTTTAGVISSWWVSSTQLEPEDGILPRNGFCNCCGQDLSGALHRSCSYSFGSICFGSLLVAISQTFQKLGHHRHRNRSLLSLVLQCLAACFREWLEYFNSWAFCYVGMYGYDYLTAGRKVTELFKARGWTTLITDSVVSHLLLLVHLGTAAVTGVLCMLVILIMGRFDNNHQERADAASMGFVVGFFVGMMISRIVLFVVESAVQTIMVCFAEQPGEGHMHLLHELKETYADTYPDVFVFPAEGSTELQEIRNVV